MGNHKQQKLDKKGRDSNMMNIDYTKNYRLPISKSLQKMRIHRCPMDCGENIFIVDRLESDGFIKIYEYLNGTFYVPTNTDEINDFHNNVVPIATISISIRDEQTVQIDKIFCEFGHEGFIGKLVQQIINFADFYGLRVGIVDIRKGDGDRNIRKCRFVDMKIWE